MFNYFRQKIQAVYYYYSRYQLRKMVPKFDSIINEYSQVSDTTGTKYPTLYQAVKIIFKHKPRYILESGTGTSTLIFAEAVSLLQEKDKKYECLIVSMESVPEWYDIANANLPERYNGNVEIILGERKLFQYSMFRGYIHSNIPKYNYDLVFVDGPNYNDEHGSSSCMDGVYARLISNVKNIWCVVDTRVSTVFVMQKIFGLGVVKYHGFKRTCAFLMPPLIDRAILSSGKFNNTLFGKLECKPLTKNKIG